MVYLIPWPTYLTTMSSTFLNIMIYKKNGSVGHFEVRVALEKRIADLEGAYERLITNLKRTQVE